MEAIIDFDAMGDAGKRQTIEDYNKELDEGEADYKKGNYITTEELKKRMEKS